MGWLRFSFYILANMDPVDIKPFDDAESVFHTNLDIHVCVLIRLFFPVHFFRLRSLEFIHVVPREGKNEKHPALSRSMFDRNIPDLRIKKIIIHRAFGAESCDLRKSLIVDVENRIYLLIPEILAWFRNSNISRIQG